MQCYVCSVLYGERENPTVSSHSWVCPIFNKEICETHCAEIEIDKEGVEASLAKDFVKLPSVDEFCATCEYGFSHDPRSVS